jgi:hypothetical protein
MEQQFNPKARSRSIWNGREKKVEMGARDILFAVMLSLFPNSGEHLLYFCIRDAG